MSRSKRSDRDVRTKPERMSRRTYVWVRGRNSIALVVVLGAVTVWFVVAGMETAAVRSGFLCAAAVYLAARTVWTLKRYKAEGKLDPTWPVI